MSKRRGCRPGRETMGRPARGRPDRRGPGSRLAVEALSGLRGPGRLVLLIAAGLILTGCGSDGPSEPPGPVSGTAVLVLDGAAADDRAVLLEVDAGATGVEAGSATLEVHARADGQGGWTVAVFGPLSGPLVRLSVPDTAALPSATIREVAAGSGALRYVLGGYTVRVEVPR